jgi:predicted ferric reductase
MEGSLFLTIARWSGLLAMLLILFQLLSMGKGRTLEKLVSKQQIVKLHRKGAWPLLPLIFLHAGLVIYGRSLEYEDSILETLRDFFVDGKWGSLTGIGSVLLLFALLMSILFLNKKILFSTFKKTHQLMYIAAPALFFHQIFFGLDFLTSNILMAVWIALCGSVALDLLIWKGRMIFALYLNSGTTKPTNFHKQI